MCWWICSQAPGGPALGPRAEPAITRSSCWLTGIFSLLCTHWRLSIFQPRQPQLDFGEKKWIWPLKKVNKQALPPSDLCRTRKSFESTSKKPSKEIGHFQTKSVLEHDRESIYHMKDAKTFMVSQCFALWMQHVSSRMCAPKQQQQQNTQTPKINPQTHHDYNFERGKMSPSHLVNSLSTQLCCTGTWTEEGGGPSDQPHKSCRQRNATGPDTMNKRSLVNYLSQPWALENSHTHISHTR